MTDKHRPEPSEQEVREMCDRSSANAGADAEFLGNMAALSKAARSPDPLRDRCKALLVTFEGRRPSHQQNSFVLLQTQNVEDLLAFVRAERKAGELHTALEAARQDIVFAIAFLGRDAGSGRLETTVPALIKRLADADTAIRAVL